jgi:hypothetical protein
VPVVGCFVDSTVLSGCCLAGVFARNGTGRAGLLGYLRAAFVAVLATFDDPEPMVVDGFTLNCADG